MSLPTSPTRPSSIPIQRSGSSAHDWTAANHTPQTGYRRPKASSAFRIEAASSGDHAAIYHFLTSLSRGPTETEFQLALDRPHYSPSDRLLLRHGRDLVGHLRLTRRQIRMGDVWVPTCELTEFALLPEYGGEEPRRLLLDAATRQARVPGAVILTRLANREHAIQDSRWIACGESSYCEASPRDVLANCADQLADYPHAESLYLRPWRYVEQRALDRLYQSRAREINGAPLRDEEYWHWLLVRRGYDNILVATTNANVDLAESEVTNDQIVAYAFVRGADIVEMMVSPDCPEASLRLIKRVAADAIERDEHQVRVFGPPRAGMVSQLLERIFPAKSSTPTPADQSICILDYGAFLQASWRCHAANGTPRDLRLGLQLDDESFTVVAEDGELRIERGSLSRPNVRAVGSAIAPLLTGRVKWKSAELIEGVEPSSLAATKVAQRFFQPLTFWRSTLDDLPSFQ